MTRDKTEDQYAGTTDPRALVRAPDPSSTRVEGFEVFFAAEYVRVVRTVYLIVHDQGRAEELTQDAFIKLLGRWSVVSAYDQPGAWVRRVAIRMAVRWVSRERTRRVLERRAGPLVAAPDPSLPRSDVLEAVRSLPAQQRAEVVLHYFEDRPITEIAEVLGCAPATARVHLHKARARLAAVLEEEVDDVAG